MVAQVKDYLDITNLQEELSSNLLLDEPGMLRGMGRKVSHLGKVVAANVKRLRAELGITEEEVKRRSGISQKTFNNIANAEHSPTISTIEKVAKGLGVDPWELMLPEFGPGIVVRKGETASPEAALQLERIYTLLSKLPPEMLDKFEGDAQVILQLLNNPEG